MSMEPGWYPDPFSSGGYIRWWDGERWGASTSVSTTAPVNDQPGVPIQLPPPPSPGTASGSGSTPLGAPAYADPEGRSRSVAPIPLASWPQRAGARIIDALIEGAIGTPFVVWLVWPAYSTLRDATPDGALPSSGAITEFTNAVGAVSVAATVITLVVGFLYQVPQNVRWGRTVGKRVVGLRIRPLAEDGSLSWPQATVRWATYAIGSALTQGLFGIIDYLWPLWDKPWRQALHDKTARTIVVPHPRRRDVPPYTS
jgi:uncharacterized RDD family membrane protein YckC